VRRYELSLTKPDGETAFTLKLPSVTSIIRSVMASPGLLNWYYSVTVQGISKLVSQYGDKLPADVPSLHSLLSQHKLSPHAIRDEAAKQGTRKHELFAQAVRYVRGERKRRPNVPDELISTLEGFVSAIPRVYVEQSLFYLAPTGGYAGTADLIAEHRIFDLKTSPRVYEEHFIQLGAYCAAAMWMTDNGLADFEPIATLCVLSWTEDDDVKVEYRFADDYVRAWFSLFDVYMLSRKEVNNGEDRKDDEGA
jgi:hypothetical protein